MEQHISKKKTEKYKDEPISTERLCQHLNLNDKDEDFIQFREYMDEVTKKAILDVYGNFSEFTSQILSQETLSKLTEQFKTLMPHYYTTISLLINKQVRISSSSVSHSIINNI